MKRFGILFVWILVFGFLSFVQTGAEAEEDCNLLCLEGRIGELQNELQLSQAATEPLEAEVDRLEGQITSITRQLAAAAASGLLHLIERFRLGAGHYLPRGRGG